MSKCNVCWEPLQGSSNVAPCGHIYCARGAATNARALATRRGRHPPGAARSCCCGSALTVASAPPQARRTLSRCWRRARAARFAARPSATARSRWCPWTRPRRWSRRAALRAALCAPRCARRSSPLRSAPRSGLVLALAARAQCPPVRPRVTRRAQGALRGLCPDNIIMAAHAGFAWWIDQTGGRSRALASPILRSAAR